MTRDEINAVANLIKRLAVQLEQERSAHKTALAEMRTSFVARTSADEKLIEDRRMKIILLNGANDRLNDLLRAERLARRDEVEALQERLRTSIARGDFAQMEVAALKSQTPKHPAKVGEWVRRTKLPGDQSPVGIVKQVTAIDCDGERYHFSDGDYWSVDNCEPCTHQHPAQDGQWVRRTVASGTEPVGTMIQVQRSWTLHSEYVTRGAQVVPWAHCEPCDPPQTEPTPKRAHPVAVGGYLRRLSGFNTTPAGEVARVLYVDCDGPATEYTVKRPNGQQGVWSESGCEPCGPPADHDTPVGKDAAEEVIRDFRSGDSEVSITGLFDDTKITVRREPDQDHGSRIVIRDANDMGEANIYLTESGARQMATALIGLCDVRKVPQ